MTRRVVEGVFALADVDADGYLSLKEFVECFGAKQKRNAFVAKELKKFRKTTAGREKKQQVRNQRDDMRVGTGSG